MESVTRACSAGSRKGDGELKASSAARTKPEPAMTRPSPSCQVTAELREFRQEADHVLGMGAEDDARFTARILAARLDTLKTGTGAVAPKHRRLLGCRPYSWCHRCNGQRTESCFVLIGYYVTHSTARYSASCKRRDDRPRSGRKSEGAITRLS